MVSPLPASAALWSLAGSEPGPAASNDATGAVARAIARAKVHGLFTVFPPCGTQRCDHGLVTPHQNGRIHHSCGTKARTIRSVGRKSLRITCRCAVTRHFPPATVVAAGVPVPGAAAW